jgi:RNA polymerase sigma-70 factor (ECF subfamily)
MSDDPASFADLMAQLRDGEERAATVIFQRFAGRLVGLARGRLNADLRRKVDPEDVLQSVFKSFFRRHAEAPFDFSGWDNIWAVLIVLTVRKCGRRVETFHAAKRDARREVPLPGGGESSWGQDPAGHEPTPEEVAMLTETLENLMRDLDEHARQILTLRLQGYQLAEIAGEVGLTERTVQRVMRKVRDRLDAIRATEGDLA